MEQRLKDVNIPYRTGRIAENTPAQIVLKDPAGNGVELNFAE